MTRNKIIEQIHHKKSFLCVGLDTDISKIPKYLLDFEVNFFWVFLNISVTLFNDF
mgnify:CR=1 FL=1